MVWTLLKHMKELDRGAAPGHVSQLSQCLRLEIIVLRARLRLGLLRGKHALRHHLLGLASPLPVVHQQRLTRMLQLAQ